LRVEAMSSAPRRGDAERGRKLFVQRCAHCHSVEPDAKQTHAPGLHGVVDRQAGSAPGYHHYSDANKNAGTPTRGVVGRGRGGTASPTPPTFLD